MKTIIFVLKTNQGFKTFRYNPVIMFATSAKDFFFNSNELKTW